MMCETFIDIKTGKIIMISYDTTRYSMCYNKEVPSFIDLQGKSAVHPGHPLTVAYTILLRFPNMESATKLSERRCMAAMEDWGVPGTGGSVNTALWLLQKTTSGDISSSQIPEIAAQLWHNMLNGWFSKILAEGQKQADHLQNKLLEHLQNWNTSF
jgi:hypothetical protein